MIALVFQRTVLLPFQLLLEQNGTGGRKSTVRVTVGKGTVLSRREPCCIAAARFQGEREEHSETPRAGTSDTDFQLFLSYTEMPL